jgi:hypothetical protein
MTTAGVMHAGYWSGSAASFVDLDPTGAYQSFAKATNGTQQGGSIAASAFNDRATLWSGTPGSAVNLHPASGYIRSFVNAMTGTMQGGYAEVSLGTSHAMIWSGTAGSFVDLNPSGYIGSFVTAMAGSQQAGYGLVSGGGRRALLWNGSARFRSDQPHRLGRLCDDGHPAGWHDQSLGRHRKRTGGGVVGHRRLAGGPASLRRDQFPGAGHGRRLSGRAGE